MKRPTWAGLYRPLAAVAVCMTLGLTFSGEAQAQAVRGTLLGTVIDAQEAAIPGATVTATETQTNIARSVVTNESGYYIFANMRDGVYRVKGELSGFKTTVRDNVEVKVNSTVRVNFILEVGEMFEMIEVAAETPVLQTDRADTGRTIEGRQIQELPLGYNRSFQGMWATVPGSVQLTRPHSQFFNPQDSQQTKFNGQSRLSNNVQIDGLDNNHKTGLLTILIPSAESIDSVSVTTSNFDAEFGRAGGSVTSLVMKSGTNQFRGSAFFFGNNESTQARNSFASADSEKPDTKYQQFGASLGGPIMKDKLFFFADYQRTVDDLGQLRRVVVPPAPWRTGDFSGADTIVYDPATGNPDGTGRQPFPGNIVPADRISPVSADILALMPPPNLQVPFGQDNFELASFVRQKTTDAFNVKLNYNPTNSDQLSFRFSYAKPEVSVPGTYGDIGGAGANFNGVGTQTVYSTALNWTRVISPSLVMEWRAGLLTYTNTALPNGFGLNTSTEVGIPGANYDAFSSGISTIWLGQGFDNPMVGFANSLPWDRGEDTYSVVGMITKLTGNHSIKLGTEIRHNEDFLLQIQDAGGTRGRFNFTASQTAIPEDSAAVNGLANSFASFLLDAPGLVERDIKVLDRPGTKHWEFFMFIQDKWQVTPKLTLDLGLRWEYYSPLIGIEDQGGLANYDPSNNTVQVAGFGNVPQNIGVQSTWTNFAPRLGAAYRLNEKTVFRAGFGTSIIPFPDNRYAFNFPVKQTEQFTAPNSFAPAGRMANGFGPLDFFPIPNDGIVDASIPQLIDSVLFSVPSDLKEAKIHSWNVAFQRELPWNLVLDVAYVGNTTRNALYDFDLNAGQVLGADTDGQPFNQLYGRTARVRTWYPLNMWYNGLQMKLDRRFRNGFQLTTSYTLSRATNYRDDNSTIQTPTDIERSKGPANFDRTHVFASSFIWELPYQNDRSALGWILGDWQLSGLFTAYSGTPINFTASGATLRAPRNTQRPDVSGTPEVIGDAGPGQFYFDTSAFSAPAQNTWGNMTRNDSIRGPGFWNLDTSLVKRLRFKSTTVLELRVDAFNLTNTPHYNNPNGSLGNTRFGQITSSFGERLVRFGARLLF